MKLLHFTILCVLSKLSVSQKSSPCPEIFSYEPRGSENDRWYGVLSLKTEEDLSGVWLHVVLDRPAELLGNWFGEASSTDNIEYTIRNSKYKLAAGPPVSVRFFVKYNTARPAPSLETVRLNGKTICTTVREHESRPTTPTLHISQLRPTESSRPSSSNNGNNNRPNNSNNGNSRPSSSNNGNSRPGSSNNENSRPSSSNNGNSRPSSSNSGNNRPSNSNSGNNRPSNNVNERPSSNTNRPSSNDNRPSNSNNNNNSNTRNPSNNNGNNRPSSDYGNSNSYRPSSTGRPSYNSESTDDDPISRPSNRPSYGSSGSSGVILGSSSIDDDDDETEGESEFFQGDFANLLRPAQNRPTSSTNQVGSSSSSCGTVAARASPLISHGQDTWPGQWPWHAALYHSKGIQLMYTCGATLITNQHVVTAAHCVTKPQTTRIVNPNNILVYLGKYNLITFGPDVQDRGVADIFVHPEYNHSVYYNDIAVLKLSRPVTITNYVRPCCLWDGDSSLDNILLEEGTVIGWGFDENKKLSNKLMQAKMPVVSTVDCIYSNRDFFSRFTFEKNYCAGFRNGTSVCNGDSGGGMIFPRRGSNGQTAWQIRGIVSVGVALQGQGVCDTSQYIVFTDVAKHTHWIRQVIAN